MMKCARLVDGVKNVVLFFSVFTGDLSFVLDIILLGLGVCILVLGALLICGYLRDAFQRQEPDYC
jgi:hypothetical protein